jgi:hypothetical protein
MRKGINQSKVATHADSKTQPAFTSSELNTALGVLRFLVHTQGLNPGRPVSDAITAVETYLHEPHELPADDARFRRASQILKLIRPAIFVIPGYPRPLRTPDTLLSAPLVDPSISPPPELSLPANLSLNNRSALVTDGRLT